VMSLLITITLKAAVFMKGGFEQRFKVSEHRWDMLDTFGGLSRNGVIGNVR
jgi:hypothetical protein